MAEICTVWEGESLSKSGDATKWVNAYLIFRRDQLRSHRYIVEGRGLSIWRELRIVFLITGELELSSSKGPGQFRFLKQHTGTYTNQLEFKGTVLNKCFERGMVLKGDYAGGKLRLRQNGGDFEMICGLLTGRWTGESTSRSDVTVWSDLSIRFFSTSKLKTEMNAIEASSNNKDLEGVVHEEGRRKIRFHGSGVSQWRAESIPFQLQGTWDVVSNIVHLEKIHTGKYTNRVLFTGSVRCSAVECVVSAEFTLGVLKLQQLNVDIAHDNPEVVARLGRPSLLVRALSTLRDSVASSHSSNNHNPSSSPSHSLPGLRQSNQEVVHCIVSRIELLCGAWRGESVDDDGTGTSWNQTRIEFELTSPLKMGLKGDGVSVWKQRRIPFLLTGSLDLKSGGGSLRKQHTGAFTNHVLYNYHLIVLTEAEEVDFDRLWLSAISSEPTPEAQTRRKIDRAKMQQMAQRLRFNLWASGEEGSQRTGPRIRDISRHACLKLIGSYGRGLLCLTRAINMTQEKSSAPSPSSIRHLPSSQEEHFSPREDLASHNAAVETRQAQATVSRQPILKAYKSFISGVLVASGVAKGGATNPGPNHPGTEFDPAREVKLNRGQRQAVLDYRLREDISEAEHLSVLKELELNPVDVDISTLVVRHSPVSERVATPSRRGGEADQPDPSFEALPLAGGGKSVCIVCMEKQPTLACVPCGHVCLCEEDARSFSVQRDRRCPICRNHVQAMMKVYL